VENRAEVSGTDGIASAAEASQAAGGLRGAARSNQDLAWNDRLFALKLAARQAGVHYALGIAGIIAGVVAGTAAIAEAEPLVTGIAAGVATLFTTLQTFLKPMDRAHNHWNRGAGLGALSLRWEVLVKQDEEPTQEQFDELITEWRTLHEPQR
jgi:hypothetical protein